MNSLVAIVFAVLIGTCVAAGVTDIATRELQANAIVKSSSAASRSIHLAWAFSPCWTGSLTALEMPIGFAASSACTPMTAALRITDGATIHEQPVNITCGACTSAGAFCTEWQSWTLGVQFKPCATCGTGQTSGAYFRAVPLAVRIGSRYQVQLTLSSTSAFKVAFGLSSTDGYEELSLVNEPAFANKVVTFRTRMSAFGAAAATDSSTASVASSTTPSTTGLAAEQEPEGKQGCNCPETDPDCSCASSTVATPAAIGGIVAGVIVAAVIIVVLVVVVYNRRQSHKKHRISVYADAEDHSVSDIDLCASQQGPQEQSFPPKPTSRRHPVYVRSQDYGPATNEWTTRSSRSVSQADATSYRLSASNEDLASRNDFYEDDTLMGSSQA